MSDQKATVNQEFISEPRVLRFTYARKFGSEKRGSSGRRKTGSEDKQKRAGR